MQMTNEFNDYLLLQMKQCSVPAQKDLLDETGSLLCLSNETLCSIFGSHLILKLDENILFLIC